MLKIWASPGESRYSTVACRIDHLLLVRTSVTINEVYSLNACSNSSLSHHLHHSKGTERNKENEISSNDQPVLSWSAKLFIDESAKRWRDFSGKYEYNQLCKRENILRNIQARTQGDPPLTWEKKFRLEMSKRGKKVPPRYVGKKECARSAQIPQNYNEKGREKRTYK